MERPQEEFGEDARNLTVRDRMNHAFLLASSVLVFQRATTTAENMEGVIGETVMALFDLIPDLWEDEQFQEDIAAARSETTQDVRPSFCGVPATADWCESHGVPVTEAKITFNHHLLMKACVNLLERRGLLTRKIFKEIFTGRRHKKKGQDVAAVMDELAQATEGY